MVKEHAHNGQNDRKGQNIRKDQNVRKVFSLIIYDCPFEKVYKIRHTNKYNNDNSNNKSNNDKQQNSFSQIVFTTKKGNGKNKFYKLTNMKCEDILKDNITKTLDHKNEEECVEQILHQQNKAISRFEINISNTPIVKEIPNFFILEYYYYNLIELPTEYKDTIKNLYSKSLSSKTSSQKPSQEDNPYSQDSDLQEDNVKNPCQYLMLYPELLFPPSKESPTIIKDYIERYIPSFHGQFNYLTYNQTIRFRLNHSKIQLSISQQDYIKFSPKQFLEYLDKVISIESNERKTILEQFEDSINVIDVSI